MVECWENAFFHTFPEYLRFTSSSSVNSSWVEPFPCFGLAHKHTHFPSLAPLSSSWTENWSVFWGGKQDRVDIRVIRKQLRSLRRDEMAAHGGYNGLATLMLESHLESCVRIPDVMDLFRRVEQRRGTTVLSRVVTACVLDQAAGLLRLCALQLCDKDKQTQARDPFSHQRSAPGPLL